MRATRAEAAMPEQLALTAVKAEPVKRARTKRKL
jgi:hypothetical protein